MLLNHNIVIEHDYPRDRGRLRLPIEAAVHQIRRGPEYRLVGRDAFGQMGKGFYRRPTVRHEILGGLRVRSVIRARISTDHFRHAHDARTYKSPGYSGIEAGFLLAVGELSGGVTHIQALLQDHDARARR